MIQRAWLYCAATSLASIAAASPSGGVQTTRTFVLDGEVLVYSPRVSNLPVDTIVAPRGAQAESDLLFQVMSIAEASPDLARFASGPMVHPTTPLVLGEKGATALTLGDLSLHRQDGQWTFFGEDGELKGRPILSFTESAAIKRLSDFEFTLSGELTLDETMAAELGLHTSIAPPYIVGSATIHGSSYPGTDVQTNPASPTSRPIVASSALSAVGPDVIVSTIGPSFAEYGASGTIGAYAVTTVSCNIGTTDAIWIDCTSGANCNQHPVIGTQVYRLKTVAGATRFEQVGMSWLKHGFCALDAPNCGTPYTPNGSCDWLGLFATDTYGSSLNASQPGCGPRSEIQPWTGVYPYPYVLGSGTGSPGGIYKRCQVEAADLDPAQNTGASYLGEVVYICTDEPDANKYNNYSNRATTVGAFSGGQYNLEFSGTTNAQQSALQRWPVLDPGVTLVNVDTPGDGRFIVGAKVTDLGGGQWNYEYAVFNMNNHDSAQRVTIPVASSVTVTPGSIGFHDVPYHSGEPYSGTDWTSVRNAANLEWSTESYFVNPNANAIRWSTTYNFRFVANVPPYSGSIELGLFRSGGTAVASGVPVPDTMPVAYCFGDGSGTACPCANAGAVGNGCAHSSNPAGANLAGTGFAHISSDTLLLSTTGMPNGPGLYFQADLQAAGGAGFPFGDGLLCVTGTIIRLGVKFSVAGVSTFPGVGDPSLSTLGAVAAGDARSYQQWYRDAFAFCTTSNFNLTNGVQVTWIP